MDDFYLTLPSSTETPSFSNTLSVYTTRLPQVLNLEKDKWVVGTTDIIYPYSYKNVNKVLKCYIHFKDARQPVYFNFPANQYKTVDQVLAVLNGNPRKRRNVQAAVNAQIAKKIQQAHAEAEKEKSGDKTDEEHGEALVEALVNQGGRVSNGGSGKDSGKSPSGNVDLKDVVTQNSVEDPENDSEKSGNNSNNTSHAKALLNALRGGGQDPTNTDAQSQGSTSEPKTSSGNSKDTSHEEALVNALNGGEKGSEGQKGRKDGLDKSGIDKQTIVDSEILAFLLTFILLTMREKEERDQLVEAIEKERGETAGVNESENVEDVKVIDEEKEDENDVLKRILEKHFNEMEKLHGVDTGLQEAVKKMLENQTTFLETFQTINNPNTLNSIVSKMSDDQSAFLKALSEKETDSSGIKKAIDGLKSQLINNSKYEYKKLIGAIEESRLDELTSLRSAMKPKNVPFIGNLINFKVENDVLKVEFKDSNVLFVEFDKECAYFLGFHNSIVKNNETASSSIDFFGNISTLYVYCDVVDQSIVGNSKSSLLTVIPCKGKYGEMVQHTFPVPRYLPLMNGTIDSIKVQILSEFGDRIHFNWGSTIITLHFRKIV
ncbi:hypothetical protein CRE_24138 [Caenorhabditis remanei]|uniref:Uncharacterized protein n=1 Tax=Caenorhabditis remanei TaxID=31234 RepID=E3N458_CAERE|nr:hypothetical protein CRE_24138 [Caenorhabditis remanei]